MNLRKYQGDGKGLIFNEWKQGRKAVMFQLPTGGGKTIIFVEIIKAFVQAGKRVILIAHREELITQAWQTLYNNKIYSGIIKSGITPDFRLPCQVASIQTICRRQTLPAADLVIIDEAHHSQDDNSYGDVLLKHFPYARILGVTATPYRLGGKGFRKLYEVLIEASTFGASLSDLTRMGYLAPIRYFVSFNPDLSKAKISSGDYQVEDAANAMELAPIVDSYYEHCAGMSGLCFAVNIEHSNKIVRQYLERGVPCAHVDANTDSKVRRKLFDDLRAKKILVLVNVGIATEGTDIPNVDFVQLARPTKSLSLYLQMIGRGTRVLSDAIKDSNTDEERFAAVAMSTKPYCYVLDNAGLFKEHGLPDRDFDWQTHFIGREKKKKKAISEEIEILEFIAEDEDGNRVISRIPEEIEGLKLIEVNNVVREKIVNLLSIKEFDKLYAIFCNMPTVDKPGIIAYFKYKQYCERQNVLMNAPVWDYLYKKLVDEPKAEVDKIERRLGENAKLIADQFGAHSPEAEAMISAARSLQDGNIRRIKLRSMAGGFLLKEKAAYLNAQKKVSV